MHALKYSISLLHIPVIAQNEELFEVQCFQRLHPVHRNTSHARVERCNTYATASHHNLSHSEYER